jgi:flagellin
MAFSVNTNQGAFVALQSLNQTNRGLAQTQNRINTGLAVSGASDGAATFAIAQGLRSDVGGLTAVQGSLDRSISAVDVALNASESISTLLIDLRETATSAADPGLDADSRSSLEDEFKQVLNQIDSIISSAEFNGTNMVSAANSVVAIDGDGAAVFSVSGVDLSGITATIQSTFASAASAASTVARIDTAATTVNGLLSDLGAGQNRLELQRDFTSSLRDTLEVGIGNLVDADLARESANLQALQVRQQLGLQALGIANQAPGAILSLF